MYSISEQKVRLSLCRFPLSAVKVYISTHKALCIKSQLLSELLSDFKLCRDDSHIEIVTLPILPCWRITKLHYDPWGKYFR